MSEKEKFLGVAKNMEINTTNLKSIIHKNISQSFECSEWKTPGRKQSTNQARLLLSQLTLLLWTSQVAFKRHEQIINVFSTWIVLVPLKGIKLQQIIDATQ